jgi:uncharacterized OB-fold protein
MSGPPTPYTKFLPEGIPAWQEPFWDSLRQHDVRVQRCLGCSAYRYHPKEKCSHCASREAEWSPISGRGLVYTFTVIRRAPTAAYTLEVPYPIAHVTMQEGFRMIASVAGMAIDDLHIGMPVVVDYLDVTPGWTLLTFRRDPQ